MELQVIQNSGEDNIKLTVNDDIFGCDFNEPLLHQVVTAYLAKGRSGSKAQKTRSEVQGGGIKPWRQKGSGRARAGSIRSPIWRKGGVTFAAKPRDYSQKVNKNMYRKAMKVIFSELNRQDRLVLINNFELSEIKTKILVNKLKILNLSNVLIVTNGFHNILNLSARNIPNVATITAEIVDPVSLISAEKILMTVDAVKKIEERFA